MGSCIDDQDMVNFESLGIAKEFMQDRFPDCKKQSGLILVVGTGRCVWEDLRQAGMVLNDDLHPHIMCINDMIMHFPGRVDHAYSNNHDYLRKWIQARRDQYLTRWEPIKSTHSNKTGGKYTWPWPGHGTSSLNGVYTALALGYEPVHLCGIPLDNSGHYFDPPWIKSNFEREIPDRDKGQIKYWYNAANKIFKGRVKSYSGRTQALLGTP